jgi:hypothetical protein
MNNFRKKTLKEIKIWAWAATVLPITSLAGLFFLHHFGWDSLIGQALVIGATIMCCFAVIWWWWAIYTIAKVTHILDDSVVQFNEVKKELSHIKEEIKSLK